MSSRTFTLLLAASVFALTLPARADNIPFTSDHGPYGKLWNGAVQMGAFTFTIEDPNHTHIGVNIFGQWELADPLIGSHVDFNGVVFSDYITSADFTDTTASVTWPDGLTSLSGLTATLGSGGAGMPNGHWWSSDIVFNSETDGASGFTGYFVTAGSSPTRTPPVPEPATFGLLGLGLVLLGFTANRGRH